MAGDRLNSTMVEVVFGPGEASEPHTHPCPVLGYVLEGAVRMKVGDGPEVTYSAGETFHEEANQRHLVSANASRTAPARFLAVLVCDVDGPLSRPLPKEPAR
jgi:quercetin dioxygenase-like cupin family protein